jgi:transaldolase
MRLFVDGADPREIRDCVARGSVEGATISLAMLARAAAAAGRDATAVLSEICSAVPGPVAAEVAREARAAMLREARALARLAPNIVVKLPLGAEGLEVVRACAAEGIKTHVTLCADPLQALLAARAGAAYVSPSTGKHDDLTLDAFELCRKIVGVYRTYGLPTEVLVASVRNPNDIVEAALVGAHVAAVPPAVLATLAKSPLTERRGAAVAAGGE